eukprot:GFKZ01001495.1.p1 GENE.GFKZ01001495.1~~GFKZ01001495.1.p1  ORF type:complete len:185 (-),score=12.31 GFKZ01001495.1:14-508(-)
MTAAAEIVAIPTIQRSAVDLLEFGEVQEREKDRLLRVFLSWATEVRTQILQRGPYWCDITDPVTGCAYFGNAAGGYSDVEGMRRMLGYATRDAGGCTVLKHPQWGFAIYPATLFTTASVETTVAALEAVHSGRWAREVCGFENRGGGDGTGDSSNGGSENSKRW